MSIIIRLQNLPLSAKSADIRKFFGGLRIPDGGVHILGGDSGDAFIGFNSDEDARLAMRKDGGKVKDSRVRLYLSSRMEMQHEVEKITKSGISESSQEQFSQDRDLAEFSRHRSPERRRHSRSQSPFRYDKYNEGNRKLHQHHQRSRSPIDYDSRRRSRSPSRRSRSFRRSPRNSLSPKARSPSNHFQKKRSISPKIPHYTHSIHDLDAKDTKKNFAFDYKHKEIPLSTSEIQAELERRITEAMEKNSALMSRGSFEHPEIGIPSLDLPPGIREPFPGQNIPSVVMQNDLHFSPLPAFFNNNFQQFPGPDFKHNLMIDPQGIPPAIVAHPEMLRGSGDFERQRLNDGFYIAISGLDPVWNFREIQKILKGIYAPQSYIRFETNNAGYKTGAAFIKLSNRDDFEKVLNNPTVFFHGQRITASECPEFLRRSYFQDSEHHSEQNVQQNRDLCYVLKGLPFTCTYDDVVIFFQGLEVADVVVFYGKDNKATGTGYVSFTNRKDFEGAMGKNGKKIGHRYIEMLPCTEREMAEAKKQHPSAHSFKSYSKILCEKKLPASRRPLCAAMTGLPHFTSAKALLAFFSDAGLKPDAIHITQNKINGKARCDGRAFVEFTNFRDFDLALKLHGNSFRDNVICVKQSLYDEMLKILDTQKAKHYFNIPESVAPALDVPDKVPYLWDPPDETESEEDKKKVSNMWLEDQYLYSNNSEIDMKQRNFRPLMVPNPAAEMMNASPFPARPLMVPNAMGGMMDTNNFLARPLMAPNEMMDASCFPARPLMTPNAVNEMVDANSFPTNKRFQRKKNFSPRVKQLIHIKTETESEINAKNVNREPIKFNVNKQVINTKTAKTFDSVKSAEEKFKLSKLSPDKETRQANLNKDFKVSTSKTKDTDSKHRSPERKSFPEVNFRKGKGKLSYNTLEFNYLPTQPESRSDSLSRSGNEKELSFQEVNFRKRKGKLPHNTLEFKYLPTKPESRSDSLSRSRNEKELKQINERKTNFRRSSPHLDIMHSEMDRRFEDRSQECTVQMSNVSISVGNRDFLQFLEGFAFYEDSIIRRYANEEPTGDVRVAFVNRTEAELAIRSLSGRRLKSLKVNMFIA